MAAESYNILKMVQFFQGTHGPNIFGASLICDQLEVASIQPNVKLCFVFNVRPEFLNPFNHIQSGVLITLTDAVTCAAAAVVEKSLVNGVSLEMSVRCIKDMVPGQKIYAEAEAIRGDPRFFYCKAEFRDENGALVAQSSQVIYVLPNSRATKKEKDLRTDLKVKSNL